MEVNGEAERLEGRDGVKTSRGNFSTPLKAAGSARHAILRGFTDMHYFTCPAVVTQQSPNTLTQSQSFLCNPVALGVGIRRLETWEIHQRQKIHSNGPKKC